MIWDDEVCFEGYSKIKEQWFNNPDHFLGDPPIDAQYALDLLFKTLIDDKEQYSYLTSMPESISQTNSIMLELILEKYSRRYRRYCKKLKKERSKKKCLKQ